ncbi:hypothetical protein HAALTHF_10870n [Vreelandella aquamarina]|nr:hypothetical protein HAALTHF_10870n [Halomonas axialensis]
MIAEAGARRLVPSVLELGGKSANIVFADAKLDEAVAGAQAAILPLRAKAVWQARAY